MVTPPAATITIADILTTIVLALGAIFYTCLYLRVLKRPLYPNDDLGCCTYCYTVKGCVGSDYDPHANVCRLLLYTNGRSPGRKAICSLGLEDLAFSSPLPRGNIYPGPCRNEAHGELRGFGEVWAWYMRL